MHMHPELLNNSHFLRYYKQWQEDPDSIVFVPVVEYFLRYSMIDEAFKVCRQGIRRHPMLVSGRIAMAKIHIRRGNWEEAADELGAVLSQVPGNTAARALMEEVARRLERDGSPAVGESGPSHDAGAGLAEDPRWSSTWNTITMANIYASQGHLAKARAIYRSILDMDPDNAAARDGLESLPAG